MTRFPILAGGAVLAALVLCGGGIAVANAVTSHDDSHVLRITGVTTAEPGDDNGGGISEHHGGVTVVTPSDPTRIDDHGDDAAGHDVGDDNGDDVAGHDVGDDHGGTSGSDDSGSDGSHSGSGSNGGDDGGHHDGGHGGHDGADG